MAIRLLVRGDRACFRRPEFSADVVSYDVITPMAARGIVEAVYAVPELRWRIDEIRVLRPIRTTWMSLAEASGTPGSEEVTRIHAGQRDQRMANVLSDVAYLITVRAEAVGEAPDAAAEEATARLRARIDAARFVRQPYLGVRNFAAELSALAPGDPLPESALTASGAVDLGWMIHDLDIERGALRYFRPIMIAGVIDLRPNSISLVDSPAYPLP